MDYSQNRTRVSDERLLAGSGAEIASVEAGSRAGSGAEIASVEAGSPADRAGLKPGMVIQTIDGEPMQDILDWLWHSDSSQIDLSIEKSAANQSNTVSLKRELNEPWGIGFGNPLFDGIHTCVNDCDFCFIK
ncbi:MAG: PDZ domain-containing protein, partial [Coriobacteriales bacterium]|nr:PDZ domain-containing protein [Coriobacteriales bacterium]